MDLYYNGDKIQDIVYNEADGLNFEEIGYTEAPEYLQEAFDYAKEIKEGWDSSKTNLQSKFSNDKKLVFMPMVDTRIVTRMTSCFYNCTSLTTIPLLDTGKVTMMGSCFSGCSSLISIPKLDTGMVTDMDSCFYGCSELTSIPELDTGKVIYMSNCFQGCTSLTTIPKLDTGMVIYMSNCFSGCSSLTSVPELDTGKVTDMRSCFYNCSNLKRVEGISFKSISDMPSYNTFIFGLSSSIPCRYLLIKDIGTKSTCTTINTTYARVWGIADDEVTDARQSLIDSLLTYSFDRASAGYSDCTIKLNSNVKAVLTEDEITQIQAKGYIIS